MMRSLTVGLGALTILAVTGAATMAGQTFLSFKHSPQAQQAVTVIKDVPSDPAVAVAQSIAPTAPTAHVAAAPVSPAVPAAAARPAAPAVSRPAVARTPAVRPAASAAPAPGGLGTGLGQAASVANILLNLPQVLSHPDEGAPAQEHEQSGPWNGPNVLRKKHHEQKHQEESHQEENQPGPGNDN